MLCSNLIEKIRSDVSKYWHDKSQEREFLDIAQGKETGHRIADYVDEKTTSFMEAYYPIAHERDDKGKAKPRSMGDFWLKDNGIYHPVNVKTGMSNAGNPNMVALRKVLRHILQSQIDSYYLLMIKFAHGDEQTPGVPVVYLVDMLDYTEYLSFDSGPGQIMLKASMFFDNVETQQVKELSLFDKANILFDLLEDGDKRLFRNREQEREKIRKNLILYKEKGYAPVLVENQTWFNLGT